jgi:hypothetical protein
MVRELPTAIIVATPNDGGGIDARTVRVDFPEGRDLSVSLTPMLLTVINGPPSKSARDKDPDCPHTRPLE